MKLRQTMILISFGLVPAVSMAEVSANIGFVTDYIFRGVYQAPSSAYAGIDYENDNGFYIGTWGADVDNGIETDLYFGYGDNVGDLSWGVGFTGYYYSDDYDQTYTEVNLGVGYGIFSLDVAVGDYDNLDPLGPDKYTFTSITLEVPNGPYFTYGSWGDDFDGDYLEIGYGFDFMSLDLSIALIYSDDAGAPGSIIGLSPSNSLAETALVFGITKSFGIGE